MRFPKLAITLILTTLIFAISTLVIISSQTVLSSSNQSQGKLIVINKVVNEGGGNKKASDFIINVHGNDPLPSSFSGSSSGIPVMLHMGMYSVTEKGPPGYNSTLSDDCSGGMMSAETKKCIITNIYSKGVFGVNK
jgi:hypothetical protein